MWSVRFFVRFATLAAATALGACSPLTVSPNHLQFSGDTLPYPAHYQVEAARAVANLGADPAAMRVSRPRPTLGASAFSPRRWYVCILGLPRPDKPNSMPPLSDVASTMLGSPAPTGTHNVVLYFGAQGRPTVQQGYDSPLCRQGDYEPITAEAPIT